MKYLFFDTETTALFANSLLEIGQQPRIIEFYGMLTDEVGTPLRTLSFRCNPGIKIEKKVTEITGIKDEDLALEPPFGMFELSVSTLLQEADAIVAHNLSYDMAVLSAEYKRFNFDPPPFPWERICTVEATEYIKGYRLNLTGLHQHLFGTAFSGAHSAEEDVKAMARCYWELKGRDLI
jgi:DNA polymerase III subunit epsilon